MAYAATAEPSRRADIWFDGPAPQRRWTVLLRLILAIPQYVVLLFLELAAVVVTIVAWFGALVMGRLPEWAHKFLSGVTRWETRVSAYVYLLSDVYPPFSFEDAQYPVRPVLPPNGRLNRWAVLFRFVLLIPASFFGTIVAYGLAVPLLVVTWFIVLFGGQMPSALYWAYSSLIRYLMRFRAFTIMLTSEYPWGMLGERELADPLRYAPTTAPFAWPSDSPPPPPPYAPPEAPTATATVPPGQEPASAQDAPTGTSDAAPPSERPDTTDKPPAPDENAGGAAASAPAPAAPVWPPPWDPPAPAPPRETRDPGWLELPSAARGWLIFAIVWGSILFIGQTVVNSVIATHNVNTTATQYDTVVSDFNNSKAAIQNAIAISKRCTTVACLRPSHLSAATSLRQFDSDLKSMNLPSRAQAPAQSVESDVTQLASAFTQLANSASAQAYRSTVQSSNVNTLLQTLPTDTNSLLSALNYYLTCPVCS
jgi:Domain of unknown function (DUF4389)